MKPNPFDDVVVDLRTSVTREEALVRMLGWIGGHVRNINTRDQTKEITASYISELRQMAQDEFQQAMRANMPDDVLLEKEDTILACDELANKLGAFLCAIDDEIAKGKKSALRTDRTATKASGVLHFTIGSLEEWAREKFPQYIAGQQHPMTSPKSSASKPPRIFPRTKQRDQEDLLVNTIKDFDCDPKAIPKNEPGKPGIKKLVRDKLQGRSPLFGSAKIFDNAWERAKTNGDIADAS